MASELPRFKSPFANSSDTLEQSPPNSPVIFSIPKRLSNAFLLNSEGRKPSVVAFHGDLIKEKSSRARKALVLKVLTYITILLVGLVSGIAIGHFAIPYYITNTVTVSETLAPAATSTVDVTVASATAALQVTDNNKKAKAGQGNGSGNRGGRGGSGQSTTSSTSSTAAKSTSTSVKATSSAVKTSSIAPSASAQSAQSAASGVYWQPSAGITFQLQLSSIISSPSNLPANITAFETDLFDTPVATISALKAAGKKVVCYFSAGTAENWRSDYSQFTAADLGADLASWAGEQWVLTTSANVRKIMLARISLAASKGCDAIDADNVDVYDYVTQGIAGANLAGLTTTTSIDYLTYLANAAHAAGLAIGLKNAGGVLTAVQPLFQFAVSESCVEYSECAVYKPFTNAGKPVFAIQYPFSSNTQTSVSTSVQKKYCLGNSNIAGFTTLLKHSNLDAWIYQC